MTGMDVRSAAKLVVLGCFALLSVSSCGSERAGSTGATDASDPGGTSAAASEPLEDAAAPAAPESSIDEAPSVDCPLEEDQVSQVVGSRLEPIEEAPYPEPPQEATEGENHTGTVSCGFESSDWSVGVSATPLEPQMTATTAPVPTIEGISREHFGGLNLDRSGRWNSMVMFTDGQQMFTLTVTNNASGSDTYPPTAGPPQRQLTHDAVSALVELLAG